MRTRPDVHRFKSTGMKSSQEKKVTVTQEESAAPRYTQDAAKPTVVLLPFRAFTSTLCEGPKCFTLCCDLPTFFSLMLRINKEKERRTALRSS